MAIVAPFRGWRYDSARTGGSLLDVTAPPYDVIGRTFQDELYKMSPYNVVRVDLGKSEESDTDTNNRYTRAAVQLSEWKSAGVLVRDPQPGVTIIRESYVGPDGRARDRRGFLAALKLSDFSERIVFPHEATLSGPKNDRFRLMNETRMSLSPVFLLYSLPGDAVMGTWDAVTGETPPAASMVDPVDTTTSLWTTSHPKVLSAIIEHLADSPLLIADGHHRYETALRYRDARHEHGDGPGPWDYALVYLCNMEDPGLAIFATHRMIRGLPSGLIECLPDALRFSFWVEELTDESSLAPEAVRHFLDAHADEGGAFGLYLPDRHTAYGLTLKDKYAPESSADDVHSVAYHHLDVAILHNVILHDLLYITPDDVAAGQHLTFSKNWGRAFERLDKGDSQAGFFMNPAKLPQVTEVAMGGERLPQKSTYFYPKLPTGLVFFDLGVSEL